MTRRITALVTALALSGALPVIAATITLDDICDSRTVLTQLAVDTRNEKILYSLPSREEFVAGWWIELDLAALGVRLLPDPAPGTRSGASHGPGTFLSTRACGPECLQPLRWNGAGWDPVGAALTVSRPGLYALGWSRRQVPWLLILREAEAKRDFAVTAYRLAEGLWIEMGSGSPRGVGAPAVHAHPQLDDGVVAGSIGFAAESDVAPWVPRLPVLQEEGGAQLLPVGSSSAALFTSSNHISLTTDGGETWRQSTWTPWEESGSGNSEDHVAVPAALSVASLPVVWTQPDDESGRIWLTEWQPHDGWRTMASLPGTLTYGDSSFPINHIVWQGPGEWLLITGCVEHRPQAGLLVRPIRSGKIQAPRLLPIRPAW